MQPPVQPASPTSLSSTCTEDKKPLPIKSKSKIGAEKAASSVKQVTILPSTEKENKKSKLTAAESTQAVTKKSRRKKSSKSKKGSISVWQRLLPKRQKCPKDDFFKPGDYFDNCKFYIAEKIGQGGFGQVYKAHDLAMDMEVALKVQLKSSDTDRNTYEMQVLASFQGSPHCPRVYTSGSTARLSYFSMQLLGRSLSNIRRDCAYVPNRLSANAAYRTLVQCVRALEGLHKVGQIHRDLKPSNFAVGYEPGDVRRIYLLDYGLCRSFINADKSHKEKRVDGDCGFRGTVRYASVASHERNDVSRRDDFWQLFYQFVELLSGQLPWRMCNDKAEVGRMKKKFAPEAFCRVLPGEIGRIVGHLRKLEFEEKPDYDLMANCFESAADSQGFKEDEPFDWELEDCIWLKHWKPPYYERSKA